MIRYPIPIAVLLSTALLRGGDSVVVINEIHYHPVNSALEFVELHNQLSVNVDLSGWRFDGGIVYQFDEGTVIPARGYLVVAKDPAALRTATGATGVLGPFSGALANDGETLRLWNNNGALRTMAEPPSPPAAAELWSVDLQGDGVGGVYGQVPPTTMIGPESASGLGGYWNPLTLASHPATSTNPGVAVLKDSSGNDSGLSFSITGTVSAFTVGSSGGSAPLYNDYLFLGAGNSANNITWRIDGANPTKSYALWLYGSAYRNSRIKVDANGNGSLADDGFVTPPAGGGTLVSGIVPDASGTILGSASAAGETNWSGFQLMLPSNQTGGGFDPGAYDDSLDRRRLMDEVTYNDRGSWPVGPDGSGYSLAKIDPQGGGQPENWTTSAQSNGTPGAVNFNPEAQSLSITDTSGNHLHATSVVAASLTSGGGGRNGEALVCGGTTAVDVPVNLNPAAMPDATVGAWVRASQFDTPARHEILSTDDGGYDRALTIDSRSGGGDTGVVRYAAFGGAATGVIPGGAASTADGWVFVCAVFDQTAGQTRLHVDNNIYTGGLTHGSGLTHMRIGGHPGGTEYFKGAIDNVFVFDRVLTPAEISGIRDAGVLALMAPALSGNLRALYEFEPTTAQDGPDGPPVAISEISGLGDPAFFVELHGRGATAVDLSGWTVRCSNPSAEYVIPSGSLEAGGYFVLDEATLGFRPLAGSELFVLSPQRLADAVHLEITARARETTGTGRWLTPSVPTPGTSNLFPPPRGVVINEIFHTDYHDGPEEWVELFNRESADIDLSGWRLGGGIGFTMPAGTILSAGGMLVVAKDATTLAVKYPGRGIVGNYSGRLGDDDRVTLEDPAGNLADEVGYHGDPPWPWQTDRGGASLELRDPAADNSLPESWAASATGHLGAWETVSYAGVAADDGIGNDAFRDFMLGLLDRGEVLIDDVSVREDPAGTNLEFVGNGGFESDTVGMPPSGWRCIGNHGQGRTVVITDPADPSNKCLRVVATGATEDKHNRIETTFVGSERAVVVGRTYRISFRARWVAGSNQINSRLYFNYLQRTSLLQVGDQWGTPGMPNSVAVANAGPGFRGLTHQPAVPSAGEETTVSVAISDPQGVTLPRLCYRVNGGAWQTLEMMEGADGRYRAVVPGQAAGVLVRYYAKAADGNGVECLYPAEGASAGVFFRVSNGDADTSGSRANLRILVSPEDETLLFAATNRMSNDGVPGTVIEDETTIYHNCSLRLKGSAFGRYAATEFGYNIDFPADRPFRGVHDSVSIERAGNLKELVAKHILNRAGGGYWSQFDDVAKINGPGVSGIGLIAASRTTGVFLKGLFPDLPVGTVFNHELLYQPNGTTDGDPRSLKLNNPYNHDRGTYEFADRGSDKEAYRWGWQIRNRRRDDNYAPIVRLNRAFALTGNDFTEEFEATVDVAQWMRTWAVMGLYGNDDQYGRLFAHNWRLYERPTDGRLVALPWDLDRAFNLATSSPVPPTGFEIADVIANPAYKRLFDSQMLDLVRTTCNADYLTPWIAHFGVVTGESAEFAGIAAYMSGRAAQAISSLPQAVPFAITSHGGADFTVATSSVVLQGTGWSDVASIGMAGVAVPLDVLWSGPTAWSAVVALNGGANNIVLTARNPQGVVVGQDAVTVTSAAAVVPGNAVNLVIGELHYNPAGPTPAEAAAGFTSENDFEFVELMNISATDTVNLAGCVFDAGISHVFSPGTLLPPGEKLVLPRRAAAFGMRYPGVPVADEYFDPADPTGNQLSNGGERITLRSATGEVVKSFIYDDAWPWPVEPDGAGRSLVLIHPLSNPDHSQPLNWRASAAAGGNPGAVDSHPPFAGVPDGDQNGNGRPDLLDYAFGNGVSPSVVPLDGGGAVFTLERDPYAAAAVSIERSSDLSPQSWTTVADAQLSGRTTLAGGLERLVFTVPPADEQSGHGFFRLRIVVP
ncbi:MAG: lamin tail domain-containing protein [Verrucomicrobia bacterium]|nr:lamin tail domain-containing protein [Verrucomicrobiota bacterium]